MLRFIPRKSKNIFNFLMYEFAKFSAWCCIGWHRMLVRPLLFSTCVFKLLNVLTAFMKCSWSHLRIGLHSFFSCDAKLYESSNPLQHLRSCGIIYPVDGDRGKHLHFYDLHAQKPGAHFFIVVNFQIQELSCTLKSKAKNPHVPVYIKIGKT